MTQTNAQAALQAAATVYGMTEGGVNPGDITGMAYQFKRWLDRKDAEDTADPEPEVSHHISCLTRKGAALCTCTPQPYVDSPQPKPGPARWTVDMKH